MEPPLWVGLTEAHRGLPAFGLPWTRSRVCLASGGGPLSRSESLPGTNRLEPGIQCCGSTECQYQKQDRTLETHPSIHVLRYDRRTQRSSASCWNIFCCYCCQLSIIWVHWRSSWIPFLRCSVAAFLSPSLLFELKNLHIAISETLKCPPSRQGLGSSKDGSWCGEPSQSGAEELWCSCWVSFANSFDWSFAAKALCWS